MARQIRLAYVITRSDTIGGAHVHVRDLAAAAAAAGHDVRVFVGGEGPFVTQLEASGVSVTRLKHLVRPIRPLADARSILELRAELRSFQPHLVSVHSSKAGVVARVARDTDVPLIFTAHGWSFTDGVPDVTARFFRRVERRLASRSDLIVTVSANDERLARGAGIDSGAEVRTILNAVPDVPPSRRASPGSNPPRLVSVARLDAQKDHPTLLHALAALADRTWTLDLIGDGPRETEIEALAGTLGIGDRVRFLGLRDDVADLLAEAQVFVLASNWEGLPRSIIEAFRTGLPVVASDVGGVAEQVDASNGWLVEPRSVAALSAALATALDDPAARETRGAAARRAYEEWYSFPRLLQDTYDAYESVLGEPILRSTAAAEPR